jgi:hypothetical protein
MMVAAVTWLVAVLLQPAPAPGTAPAHPGLERVAVETAEQRTAWESRLARMVRTGALRVRERRQGTAPGRQDQWLVQLHRGVPVQGAEVWRRVEGQSLVAAEGTLFKEVDVNPVPKLTRTEIVEALAQLAPGTLGPSRPPELIVLPTPDGRYALVYRARLFTGTALTTYYLDADTGAVVLSEEAPAAPEPARR